MKPKYVKCFKVWDGVKGKSILNKVYDTDQENNFSSYTWKEIYELSASNPVDYFTEVTQEEWNKQENIINNNYQIY